MFTGCATALITPFANGKLDLAAYEKLIDFQLEKGVSALLACGTTGEPSTMAREEKNTIISACVKHTAGRVPVIAGAGSNNTAEAVFAAKTATDLGANALLVVTPYYNKATPAGLLAHFKAVCAATPLPVIAYNVPGRTGLNLLPATLKKLAEIDNLVAVKEASGNLDQITQIAAEVDIDIYSGDDAIVLPILAVGGKGVISVASNIIPAEMEALCAAYFRGDRETALSLQLKYYSLIKALFCEVNPIPVKTAAALMGICTPELRLPLCAMEEKNLSFLQAAMREVHLI